MTRKDRLIRRFGRAACGRSPWVAVGIVCCAVISFEPVAAGRQIDLAILVRDSSTAQPIPGLTVQLIDSRESRHEARTNANGTASFRVPEGRLNVRLRSNGYVAERRLVLDYDDVPRPLILEATVRAINGWDVAPYGPSCAQLHPSENGHASIAGVVRDKVQKHPLSGALVIIPELECGAITDSEGRYHLRLPVMDTAIVEFRLIGYGTVADTLADLTREQRRERNILMKVTPIELHH